MTVDGDVSRIQPQASHLGVVAHLDHQRVLDSAVATRLEQQRVPVGAHFVVDLPVPDRVDLSLDLAGGHARIEDPHVGTEVRLGGAGQSWLRLRRGEGRRRSREREADDKPGRRYRSDQGAQPTATGGRSDMWQRHCWPAFCR